MKNGCYQKANIKYSDYRKRVILINNFTVLTKRPYCRFADSELPRFAEEIQNVTVSVGRDALLACVVDNLRNYKVKYLKLRYLSSLILPFAVYRTSNEIPLLLNFSLGTIRRLRIEMI